MVLGCSRALPANGSTVPQTHPRDICLVFLLRAGRIPHLSFDTMELSSSTIWPYSPVGVVTYPGLGRLAPPSMLVSGDSSVGLPPELGTYLKFRTQEGQTWIEILVSKKYS